MYTISKKIFNGILKEECKNLMGNSCEVVENEIKDNKIANNVKFYLKKMMYNSFHAVENRINSFSKGTVINVEMVKPDSE